MSVFINPFITGTPIKLSVFSMGFPFGPSFSPFRLSLFPFGPSLFPFGLSLFPFGLSLSKPIAPSTGSGRTVFKETLTLIIALLTTGCQPAFIGMDSEADIAAENCYAYRYGDKLRKINFTQAFDWCHRSARFGNANSQALLGELYYLGLGGEQDIPQAEKWFTSAARQGHAHAQFMLYRIFAVSEDSAQRGQADYWLKQARQSGYKLALQAQ